MPRTAVIASLDENAARVDACVALSCALAALLLYLRTVAPALPTGDSGDLITAAWVLGVPHPPGYPLYTMLGHLAALVPVGSPALRLNLLSAVLHAATVGLTTHIIFRLLTDWGHGSAPEPRVRPWQAAIGGAVGGLSLAFSTTFWAYSLVAEVFPLNSLLAALLLLLLLEWERRPWRVGLLRAFALGCGLAVSNHHTIVLLAPAFVVLLWSGTLKLRQSGSDSWWARRGVGGRELVIATCLLLVGLLPYLYLPMASSLNPPYAWGDPRTLENFIRHVSRAQYGAFRLLSQNAQGSSPLHQAGFLAWNLYHGFTPAGYLLAAVGAWWLAERRAIPGLALLLAFLISGPIFAAYANPALDTSSWLSRLWIGILERFYILPMLPFAVAIGAGCCQLLLWLGKLRLPAPVAGLAAPVAGIALLALPAGSAVAHFGAVDQSNNYLALHFNQDLIAPLEPGSLIIMKGDSPNFGVPYLQLVERERPDIIALNMEQLTFPWYMDQVRRRHPDVIIPFEVYDRGRTNSLGWLVEANWERRPVYIFGTPDEPGFLEEFDLVTVGLAHRLLPTGMVSDRFVMLRAYADIFKQARFPSKDYPDTSWEFGMVHEYGRVALDLAYVFQTDRRTADAVEMYRTAIRLAPEQALAYKNLGFLLLELGAEPAEVVELLEKYLSFEPDDPDTALIRQRLESLLGGQ
jgi:hypothetical protein